MRKDESEEKLLYRRRNGDKEQKEQAKKEKRNFWKRKKDKNGGADGEVEKRGIKMPIMAPYTVNGGWSKKRAKDCGVEAVFIERTGCSVQNHSVPYLYYCFGIEGFTYIPLLLVPPLCFEQLKQDNWWISQ